MSRFFLCHKIRLRRREYMCKYEKEQKWLLDQKQGKAGIMGNADKSIEKEKKKEKTKKKKNQLTALVKSFG